MKTRALRVDGNARHLAGVIQDQDCDRQTEPLGFDMVDKEFRLDAVGAYGSNGAVRGNSIAVRGNTPQSDRRLRVTSTNAATNRTRVTSTTKTICGVMNDTSMDAKVGS